MSGFNNAIVGAGGTLIRSSVRSPNYVPVTQGWALNQDGTADLASTTVRGQLLVPGPNGGYVAVNIQSDPTTANSESLISLEPSAITNVPVSLIDPGKVSASISSGSGSLAQSQLTKTVAGPAWKFGSGAGNIKWPEITMRTATYDTSFQASPSIELGDMNGSGDCTVNLKGNVAVSGSLSVAGVGGLLSAVKNAENQNNTTAFADDADLQFPSLAPGKYIMDAAIWFRSTAASGIKLRWNASGVAGTDWSARWSDSYPGGSNTLVFDNTSKAYTVPDTNFYYIRMGGSFTVTGTARTIALSWAQNVASAGPTFVLALSWIKLMKVT